MQKLAAQPAQTSITEPLNFQRRDFPMLQRAMAFIRASDMPSQKWTFDLVLRLLDSDRTSEGDKIPYIVLERVADEVAKIRRKLASFPIERDAEMEWVYQLYASGSEEITKLPFFPDLRQPRGPVFERQLKALKDFARRQLAESRMLEQRDSTDVRTELARLKEAQSRLLEKSNNLELEHQSVKSRLDALESHVRARHSPLVDAIIAVSRSTNL